MIAYKFLRAGSIGTFSGASWPAPGEWLEAAGALEACASGVHACPLDALAYWLDDELWTVELDGEMLDLGTALVARRGRLVARAEGWPQVSSEFARDCADSSPDARRADARQREGRSSRRGSRRGSRARNHPPPRRHRGVRRRGRSGRPRARRIRLRAPPPKPSNRRHPRPVLILSGRVPREAGLATSPLDRGWIRGRTILARLLGCEIALDLVDELEVELEVAPQELGDEQEVLAAVR